MSEFACIVANKTGGQGKTTVAQLLYEALLDAGVGPRLAAIDRAGGSRRRSKLGTLYPQTFDWGVAADLAELAAGQGEAALRHWDVLSRVLKQRHVVIDVGANAIDPMLRWMQLSLTADARHPMNFLVVSTVRIRRRPQVIRFPVSGIVNAPDCGVLRSTLAASRYRSR